MSVGQVMAYYPVNVKHSNVTCTQPDICQVSSNNDKVSTALCCVWVISQRQCTDSRGAQVSSGSLDDLHH